MNVGDTVDYDGTLSKYGPQKNCIIKEIELAGNMVNQDMAVLDKVEGWVSFKELTICERPYIIVIYKPTGRAFSMTRNYGVLNPDLGIIDIPTEFVEDWNEWLASDVPPWVDKMGTLNEITQYFHAYWLY